MKTFYDLLKEKATDPKTKDKIIYAERYLNTCREYSYEDVYNLVDEYIREFLAHQDDLPSDRKINLIVDNSVKSIIAIIACLKCNLIPVIFDFKNVREPEDKMKYCTYWFNRPFRYDELMIAKTKRDEFAKIIDPAYRGFLRDYGKEVEAIYKNSDSFSYNPSKHILVICSSGSVGKSSHFHLLEEEKLINNANRYGEKGSTFLSYISCANISGILTNIVNPLLNDTRAVLVSNFDINLLGVDLKRSLTLKSQNIKKTYNISCNNPSFYNALFDCRCKRMHLNLIKKAMTIKGYKVFKIDPFRGQIVMKNFVPDSVMLPRDILAYLENFNVCDIDLSKLRHIYLAGGSNNSEMIDTMRHIFPSIKRGIFTNLYGSTETYGMISTCDEEKLKTCYIDVSDYRGSIESIIYTYDKKNFYRTVNGNPVKVDLHFYRKKGNLSEFLFTPYLPVSEGRVDNLVVREDFSMRFEQDCQQELNDFGIYINDQLYILSRTSELVMPKANKKSNYQLHFLCDLEGFLRRELQTDVYCVNSSDTGVQIYVNIKDYKHTELLTMYHKCLKIKEAIDERLDIMSIDYPIFLHSDVFPIAKISGKISKGKLNEYHDYSRIQYEHILNPEESIKKVALILIKNLFKEYECSELSNNTFTVYLGDHKFLPITNSMNKIFKIIRINDSKGSVTFRVNRNVIFLTDEEIDEIMYDLNRELYMADFHVEDEVEHSDDITSDRFRNRFATNMIKKISQLKL